MPLSDHDQELDPTPSSHFSQPIYQSPTFSSESESITLDEPIDLNIGSQEVLSTSLISQSQEQTRACIALLFTRVFLFLIAISVFLPLALYTGIPELIPQPITATQELLTTIASILAGPFGFIVGFYFKKNSD